MKKIILLGLIISLIVLTMPISISSQTIKNNTQQKTIQTSNIWPVFTDGWEYWGENGTSVKLKGRIKSLKAWEFWHFPGFVYDKNFHYLWGAYPYNVSAELNGWSGFFDAIIHNLNRGQEYHFRAIAKYIETGQTQQGDDLTFLPGVPDLGITVIITAATWVTLVGKLNHLGGAENCKVWFVYGTEHHNISEINEYQFVTPSRIMYKSCEIHEIITGLEKGTQYYFRFFCETDIGVFYTDEGNFPTLRSEPPNKPETPSGPTTCKPRKEYTYTTKTTDPEEDRIYYTFHWGDGTRTKTDFYNSGETVSATHTWDKKGNYPIWVEARDWTNVPSDSSDILNVKVARTKLSINTLFSRFFENF